MRKNIKIIPCLAFCLNQDFSEIISKGRFQLFWPSKVFEVMQLISEIKLKMMVYHHYSIYFISWKNKMTHFKQNRSKQKWNTHTHVCLHTQIHTKLICTLYTKGHRNFKCWRSFEKFVSFFFFFFLLNWETQKVYI